MTKQTTLNSANPYQAGEAYAINEMVYYNGGVRIVLNTLASGSTAAETDLGDVVSDVNSSTFRVRDSASPTKKLAFDVSAVTAGQVRTLTMPDANVTLGMKVIPLGGAALTGGNTYYLPHNATVTVADLVGSCTVAIGDADFLVVDPSGTDALETETGVSLTTGGASYVMSVRIGEAVTLTQKPGKLVAHKISKEMVADHTFFSSGAHRFGMSIPQLTADRTITLPNHDVALGVVKLGTGITVAKAGAQYYLDSISSVSLDVSQLGGGHVLVVSAVNNNLTLIPGPGMLTSTETLDLAIGLSGVPTTWHLVSGEALLITGNPYAVCVQKISRNLDVAHTFLKSGSYRVGFATTTLTADRTMTLPNRDVDLQYLPRSNADTGNAMSNGGATISGTSMTLSGRVVVAAGSSVTGAGFGCFLGTNHPSSPGNAPSALEGNYCGFLVGNNLTLNNNGFGALAQRCAGGVALRASISGSDNWFGNVDDFTCGEVRTGCAYHLVRSSTSNRTTVKLQTWESVHGLASADSEVPVHGASLFTSLMRSTLTSLDKTLVCKYALSATHDASSFLTADGSQTSSYLFIPPAALGTKGVACHEVVFIMRRTTNAADASSHIAEGAAAICKRRINVYHDGTSPSSSIEVEGTDFLVGGTTTVSFTVDLSTATFSESGSTWTQPLLKITPVLMVDGTPVTRSAAAKVISTYIINHWS